jgi:hypothetical protein
LLGFVGLGEGSSDEGDGSSDVGAGAGVLLGLTSSEASVGSFVGCSDCSSAAEVGWFCVAAGGLDAGFEAAASEVAAGSAGDDCSAGDEGWAAVSLLLSLAGADGLAAEDCPVGWA